MQATRQLVEQDKVFAIFSSLGTEQNLAVRDYLNQPKVPQVFVASGATTLGRDYGQYPLTIGFLPTYQRRGPIYGKYLARTKPGEDRRALPGRRLRQGLLLGLKKGLARSRARSSRRRATSPSPPTSSRRLRG